MHESNSEKREHELADHVVGLVPTARNLLISEIVNSVEAKADPLYPIRVGITLRNRGHLLLADEFFLSCLSEDSRPSALYELGVSKALQGLVDSSVVYLETRLAERGLQPGELVFLALQYARQGRIARAETVLEDVAYTNPMLRHECLVASQAFKFMNRYDERIAIGLLEEVKKIFNVYTSPTQVEERIHQAISAREPFLMMRMGDGEGSSLRLTVEDEAEFNLLYRSNLEEFAEFWFKDKTVLADYRFYQLLRDFNEVIFDADVIGAFHLDGLENEYRIGSRRGITWAVNTLRALLKVSSSRDVSSLMVGDPNIHYQLFSIGSFDRILSGQKRLGLISCHSDLPAALRRHYAINEIEFFKIPGEQSNSSLLGADAVAGRHWPDRFAEVRSAIAGVDRQGQIFLVAAGMLGKIYARDLKKTGAIVLDIGSVADALMGKNTRSFPQTVRTLPGAVA